MREYRLIEGLQLKIWCYAVQKLEEIKIKTVIFEIMLIVLT